MRVLNNLLQVQSVSDRSKTELKRYYRMVLNRGIAWSAMTDNELLEGLNDTDRAVIIKLIDKIRQLRRNGQGDSLNK